VVKRLPAVSCRLDIDAEVVLEPLLTYELVKGPRPQGYIQDKVVL